MVVVEGSNESQGLSWVVAVVVASSKKIMAHGPLNVPIRQIFGQWSPRADC